MNGVNLARGHRVGAFQITLLFFSIVVLSALAVDTFVTLPPQVSNIIHITDTLACAIFFTDFCFRFCQAESKTAFMKWGWIDLLACIPNLEIFRYGRLVRVLRIIRLLRGVRLVQVTAKLLMENRAQGGAAIVVFTAILLVVFSSGSILVCEQQANNRNITTAEDAIWWSITTLTTVGYGDKYPVTTEGRAIGIILMLAGVGIFGVLSGLAASFFLGGRKKEELDAQAILERLDRLQGSLDELVATKIPLADETASSRDSENPEKRRGSYSMEGNIIGDRR